MRRLRLFLVGLPLVVIAGVYLAAGGSPASAEMVDFNACPTDQVPSYTEDGLTIAAAPGFHIHCGNAGGDASNDVMNHTPASFHNYTITFSGGAFSLVSLDVVAGNEGATFSNNLGGNVAIAATPGTFTFGAGWTGITSVTWAQNGESVDGSEFLAVDNLVFLPAQVQVPEPATVLLMALGLLGVVGRRRMAPIPV